MEEVTLKKLIEITNTSSVSNAIDWAFEQQCEYILKPTKPVQSINSSTDAKKYAIALEEYEKNLESYKIDIEIYKKRENEINLVITEFIKEMSGLNTIPEQYRDKVYAKAYSDAHSYGYDSVYIELLDLVEIFN